MWERRIFKCGQVKFGIEQHEILKEKIEAAEDKDGKFQTLV